MVQCDISLNECPCGEICCTSWQYCAFLGQCSELATASPNDTILTITATIRSSTQTAFSETIPLATTNISSASISKPSSIFTTSDPPSSTAPFSSAVPAIPTGNNTLPEQHPPAYHGLGKGKIISIVLGSFFGASLTLSVWFCYRRRNPSRHRRPLDTPADEVVGLNDRRSRNSFDLGPEGVALNSFIETPEVLQEPNFAEEVSRRYVERGLPPIYPPHPNQSHQQNSQTPLNGRRQVRSMGEPDLGEEQPSRRTTLVAEPSPYHRGSAQIKGKPGPRDSLKDEYVASERGSISQPTSNPRRTNSPERAGSSRKNVPSGGPDSTRRVISPKRQGNSKTAASSAREYSKGRTSPLLNQVPPSPRRKSPTRSKPSVPQSVVVSSKKWIPQIPQEGGSYSKKRATQEGHTFIEDSSNESGPSNHEKRRLGREPPILLSHRATIAHNDENNIPKEIPYLAQGSDWERQPLEDKTARQQLNSVSKERSALTQEYPRIVSLKGKISGKEVVDPIETLPLFTQIQDPIDRPKHPSPSRRTRSTVSRSLGTRAQNSAEAGKYPYSEEDSSQGQAVPFVQYAAIPEPRWSEATDRTSIIEDWIDEVRGPATRSLVRLTREKTNRLDSGADTTGPAKREERGRPQSRRLSSAEYTVGLICALFTELSAVRGALDEEHDEVSHSINDSNTYTLGRMVGHNVVLACLPNGQYGTNSAAAVATALRFRFRSVRIGLLVGIGGGVPSQDHDIRLGDVVVSEPMAQHGGVIQYDQGKVLKDNDFQRTGYLQPPPTALLTAVSKLRSNHVSGINNLGTHLSKICRNSYFAKEKGGADYLATYNQVEADPDSRVESVLRQRRDSELPEIHYGAIASGSEVIKNARVRDRISEALGGVLCFEMEAAGLMNNFPCIVIRGICDYADSHKNKDWQPYAAAAAAAYAKELLSVIPSSDVVAERTAFEVTSDLGHD
ncbi:MAG: hypothetical protein Q9157_004546 [Trypethelium eluteriae]